MRQSGHYWVQLKNEQWWVGYYSHSRGGWYLPGKEEIFKDHEFYAIKDERIEEP